MTIQIVPLIGLSLKKWEHTLKCKSAHTKLQEKMHPKCKSAFIIMWKYISWNSKGMIATFIHNVKGGGTLIPLRYQVHFDCTQLAPTSLKVESAHCWSFSSWRLKHLVFVTLKAAMTAKFKATLVVTYIQTRVVWWAKALHCYKAQTLHNYLGKLMQID